MLNVNTLRSTIIRFNGEHESKQKLADDLFASAKVHEANGDEARAKLDRESAERYQADADRAANQGSALAAEIQIREHKAAQIDKEIEEFKKHADKELQKLIDKRNSIIG